MANSPSKSDRSSRWSPINPGYEEICGHCKHWTEENEPTSGKCNRRRGTKDDDNPACRSFSPRQKPTVKEKTCISGIKPGEVVVFSGKINSISLVDKKIIEFFMTDKTGTIRVIDSEGESLSLLDEVGDKELIVEGFAQKEEGRKTVIYLTNISTT
jgi:hypothetical protein